MEDWTNRAKTGHLPARGVWQSYSQQLWSSTKYGLGACAATLKELENGLGLRDFYLMSKLGVARTIPPAVRYLQHIYCGMELNIVPVETTVAQINYLLQHYGRTTAPRTTLSAAIEHLQVEIGLTRCPLPYDYKKYSCLATYKWTKSLWEKISAYGIKVKLKYPKRNNQRAAKIHVLWK